MFKYIIKLAKMPIGTLEKKEDSLKTLIPSPLLQGGVGSICHGAAVYARHQEYEVREFEPTGFAIKPQGK